MHDTLENQYVQFLVQQQLSHILELLRYGPNGKGQKVEQVMVFKTL